MISFFSKRPVFFTVTILVLVIIVFLTFPRKEYKISDSIPEKMVIQTGHSVYDGSGHYIIQNIKYSLLDLNNGIFIDYTGSYNTGAILEHLRSYHAIIYSPNKQFYLKNDILYNKGDQTIETGVGLEPDYKYWSRDDKYLIALSQEYITKFGIRFHLGQRSVKIIDLKVGKVQQINFRDMTDSGRGIIDIVGIVN